MYKEKADLFKVLSDANRLMIIDILSCGELCACEILEKFDITQPTLSHHMKVLCDHGLASCRKEGKKIYYKLDKGKVLSMVIFLETLVLETENCRC